MNEHDAFVAVTMFGVLGGLGGLWIVSRVWLRSRLGNGIDPELSHRLAVLEEEVEILRGEVHRELADVSERVDFAERMLSRDNRNILPEPTPV